MSSFTLVKGRKKKKSDKTTTILTREDLAERTGRPPADFASNPTRVGTLLEGRAKAVVRVNPKVVGVTTPGKKKTDSNAKTKKKLPVATPPFVSAVSGCAAALAVLTEAERAKALAKLCGMFGFQTAMKKAEKGKSSRLKPVPPKPVQVKQPFNEMFATTYAGQILAKTSEVLKESAKSAENVVAQPVAAIHHEMLGVKSNVKAIFLEKPDTVLSTLDLQTGGIPSDKMTTESFQDFVNQFGAVQSYFEQHPTEPKPSAGAILALAACLRRGEKLDLVSEEQWTALSGYPVPQISLLEARSTEDSVNRESALCTKRKSQREKLKKRKADSKRGDDLPTEETVPGPKKSKTSKVSEQVMDESELDSTQE